MGRNDDSSGGSPESQSLLSIATLAVAVQSLIQWFFFSRFHSAAFSQFQWTSSENCPCDKNHQDSATENQHGLPWIQRPSDPSDQLYGVAASKQQGRKEV